MSNYPDIRDDDPEEISDKLVIGRSLWVRGEKLDALRYLKLAIEAAFDVDANRRAIELTKLSTLLRGGMTTPPPPTPSIAPPGTFAAQTLPPKAGLMVVESLSISEADESSSFEVDVSIESQELQPNVETPEPVSKQAQTQAPPAPPTDSPVSTSAKEPKESAAQLPAVAIPSQPSPVSVPKQTVQPPAKNTVVPGQLKPFSASSGQSANKGTQAPKGVLPSPIPQPTKADPVTAAVRKVTAAPSGNLGVPSPTNAPPKASSLLSPTLPKPAATPQIGAPKPSLRRDFGKATTPIKENGQSTADSPPLDRPAGAPVESQAAKVETSTDQRKGDQSQVATQAIMKSVFARVQKVGDQFVLSADIGTEGHRVLLVSLDEAFDVSILAPKQELKP